VTSVMRRQAVLVWSLVSAAVMCVGAFGPWVTALGVVSISGTTLNKHPYALAGMALAASLLAYTRRESASGGGWAALFGLAGVGLSLYDRHHITSALGGAGSLGQAFVHVGWGLDAALLGSISLLVSGVTWFVFSPDEAEFAPATPSAPTVPAGWYRDPNDDTMLRYWNGFGWTTQTAKPAS
jgi:Protein of unknown function (DUF2510)